MEPNSNSRGDWLAPLGTAFAILACYGTLAAVGALSLIGISITVPEGIWAGAIIAFALLALSGIIQGWRKHHAAWPLALGLIGTGLVLWVMVITYGRVVEIAGFLCLALGAILDWRARRNRRSAVCSA